MFQLPEENLFACVWFWQKINFQRVPLSHWSVLPIFTRSTNAFNLDRHISYLSSKYCLDCKMNVRNDLSTLKSPLLDILHTYVGHTSQKLLITLYPRWPRPPSWIPDNVQCCRFSIFPHKARFSGGRRPRPCWISVKTIYWRGDFQERFFLFDPSLTSGMSAALMQGHCLRRRPCIKQHMSGGREFHRKYHRQLPPHLTRHKTLHAAGLD